MYLCSDMNAVLHSDSSFLARGEAVVAVQVAAAAAAVVPVVLISAVSTLMLY